MKTSKRFWITLIVLSLTVLGFAAILQPDSPETVASSPTTVTATPVPIPTVTATVTPEPVETSTGEVPDSAFLIYLRGQNPVLNDWTDTEIMDVAVGTCSRLDQGEMIQTLMVEEIIKNDGDQTQNEAFAQVLGAGIANYCPAYMADLQSLQ